MKKNLRLFLFIIGMVLIVDCLVLFAHLKINFGTVVPFLIGIIFLIHAFLWQKIQRLMANKKWLKLSWHACWALFVIWFISFSIFVGVLTKQINRQKQLPQVKAVIVLGSGVNGDKPTPALASRLDKANEIIQTQPNTIPIVSGGIGFERQTSEAQIMANYLNSNYDVPLTRIRLEQQSTSTETNLKYSQPILTKNGVMLDNPIAIVTNDFHTIRAKAIAKKQGYSNIYMVASHTPLSIRFNAWFREYFAFVSGLILNEY